MAIAAPSKPSVLNVFRSRIEKFRSNSYATNFASLGSAQLVTRVARLASIIFVSRWLTPTDFGLAALALTVYELVALFTRNGIAAQVTQASEQEVESIAHVAHRMVWVACFILMGLQIGLAYPVAWMYGNLSLALPIAAMSVIYIATPLGIIQAAFQAREKNLKPVAMAVGVQAIADNTLTVILAYCGMGLWAIIIPKILVAPIWVYYVRFGHPWRPKPNHVNHGTSNWRKLMRFSNNVMGVELLTTLQANLDNILVGYFLGVQALGLYYFAFNNGLGISLGLITASGMAAFPHFCEVRENRKLLVERLRSMQKTMLLTFGPLILLQACLAPFYVPIVFGEQWVPAVPVLAIICLSALARPFATAASQVLKAIGKPEIELKWQILNTAVLAVGLLAAVQIDLFSVALVVLIVQTAMLTAFVIYVDKMLRRSEKKSYEVVGVTS